MLVFDGNTHTYTLDGKKLTSVTTLLRKHLLSPDYSEVPLEILKAAADKGTLVHDEIERWINCKEVGFTRELESFMNWVKENNVEIINCEKMVNNDIVAGKYDLICKIDGVLTIVDHKTTSILHSNSVAWQLSIYNYLSDIKCEKAGVLHYQKDGSLKFVPIEMVSNENIEKLMNCERLGIIYKNEIVNIDGKQIIQLIDAQEIILQAKKQIEQIENEIESIKKSIMQSMKENNIQKFENGVIRINYIAPYEKESIDSKKLREEQPEIAKKYTKITKVKESIKIELKGEK